MSAREPVPVDLEGLAQVAVKLARKENDDRKWSFNKRSAFERGGEDVYYLEATGYGKWARHVPTIIMTLELGLKVAALWRQNEHGRFLGTRTLAGVLKLLGKSDISEQVEAAREDAGRREVERRAAIKRRNVAAELRSALDAMQRDPTSPSFGWDEAPVRMVLNQMTRNFPDCAEEVAYSPAGVQRPND